MVFLFQYAYAPARDIETIDSNWGIMTNEMVKILRIEFMHTTMSTGGEF